MTKINLFWMPFVALALLAGCSDDPKPGLDKGIGPGADATGDPDLPPTSRGYGAPCTENTGCDSNLCVEGFCSKLCQRLSDCSPTKDQHFICGEVAALKTVACYPRTYSVAPYTMGYDCSLNGACVDGFTCLGQTDSADRYCSAACTNDQDCPPTFRCATTTTGDAEEQQTFCRRREFCHPCVIDDQCGGEEDICIADINNNKYCGKACDPSGTSCRVYAKCEDAGNGAFQCKPKRGYCYKSLEAEGGICDPCLEHGSYKDPKKDLTIAEVGVCKADHICYVVDGYTMEPACLPACGTLCTTPSDCDQEKCDGAFQSNDGRCNDFFCPDDPTYQYLCMFLSNSGYSRDYCVPTRYDPQYQTQVPGSCYP